MMKLTFIVLLLHLLHLLSSPSFFVASSYVPAIFTFGDSIVDAGNNRFLENCTAQADFPPYGSSFFHYPTGRLTNGRTVVDFISQYVGLDLQKPYLEAHTAVLNGSMKAYPSNGMNFASAGSGVLRNTNKDWGVIPIQEQLQQFETLVKENKIDKDLVPKSLFLFESGSNDLFNYFIPFEQPTPPLEPDTYVQTMLEEAEKFISQIYSLGARRIAVFSLGPVGCVPARALLPSAPTDRCFGKLNVMIKKYNMGLENLMKQMPVKYPGAMGVYGGVYKLVQQFRAMPNRYGFTNVIDACCGFGTLGGVLQCGKEGYTICKNPNSFLFWDFMHPSEHTYELISKALWEGGQTVIKPFDLKTLSNIPT